MQKLTSLGVNAVFAPVRLYASGMPEPVTNGSNPVEHTQRPQRVGQVIDDLQEVAVQTAAMLEVWWALVSIRKALTKPSFRLNSFSSRFVGSHGLTSSEG